MGFSQVVFGEFREDCYYLIGSVSTGFTWKIVGQAILLDSYPFEVAVVWLFVYKTKLNS